MATSKYPIEYDNIVKAMQMYIDGSKQGAGANVRASDVFTLLRVNSEWKITHKLFH